MSIEQLKADGRRLAESLMTGTCVIRRPTGESITDPDTLKVIPVHEVMYGPTIEPWHGACKVQSHEAFESVLESGGQSIVLVRLRVDLPVGSYIATAGDVVSILNSTDPLLEGQDFRLSLAAPYKEHASAYRIAAIRQLGEEGMPPWPSPSTPAR